MAEGRGCWVRSLCGVEEGPLEFLFLGVLLECANGGTSRACCEQRGEAQWFSWPVSKNCCFWLFFKHSAVTGKHFLSENIQRSCTHFSCRAWLLSQLGVKAFCGWIFFSFFSSKICIFSKFAFIFEVDSVWGQHFRLEVGSLPRASLPVMCSCIPHPSCFQGSLLHGGPQSQPGSRDLVPF